MPQFTPNADCTNCLGSGVFVDETQEPCIFCLEDAILRGEVNGTINGVEYVGGRIVAVQ